MSTITAALDAERLPDGQRDVIGRSQNLLSLKHLGLNQRAIQSKHRGLKNPKFAYVNLCNNDCSCIKRTPGALPCSDFFRS